MIGRLGGRGPHSIYGNTVTVIRVPHRYRTVNGEKLRATFGQLVVHRLPSALIDGRLFRAQMS
jgi:hypothetical protein